MIALRYYPFFLRFFAIVLLISVILGSLAFADTSSGEFSMLPELLVMNDGKVVDNSELWQKRKEEIIQSLAENIYGYMPPFFSPAKGKVIETVTKCCSGHAVLEKVIITVETERRDYSFPMSLILPNRKESGAKIPLVLLLNFRPDIYDMYVPTEEIIDHGFGLAIIYYEDIVPDDDYENTEKVENEWDAGLATCFTRASNGTGYGKISLWAWGASRAMDYLVTREEIDKKHIAIAGHSRLGKTALWCAANDERFFCAISNDSGCAGAAIERNHHKGAETIKDIIRYDSWFCENYFLFAENLNDMPFDQHFLLAAIAPRLVAIGSASEDIWADPENELKCCVYATPVWKLLGKEGYIGKEDAVEIGECFIDGEISYHLRDGIHYFGREDWLVYLDFMKNHIYE